MFNLEKQLLNLINQGMSLKQIREKMHLSNSEFAKLYLNLKNKGMQFKQDIYANGNIIYRLDKNLDIPSKLPKETEIILNDRKHEFKAVLIADTHIGSVYERIDLLDTVFDYCIHEGINIIIHAGDLVDGLAFGFEKKHKDYMRKLNIF